MAAASDQVNQSSPTAEEEEIILLTDVVEAPPSEVVLELASGEQGLDSELLKEEAPPEPLPEKPVAAAEEEALEDFLSSFQDLPEDLGTPAISPSSSEPQAPQEAVPLTAGIDEELRRELQSLLNEDQLRAIVREVIQERVENMSRELLPQLLAEVMDRKIAGLLKRLAEEE